MKGFKNVNAFVDGVVKKTDVAFENGVITAVGENLPIDEIVECNGILLPGFVDRHIHGAGGADGMDGSVENVKIIADNIVKEGTTSFLVTTMTQSRDNINKALNAVKAYERESGAKVMGVHLEGPFISVKYKGAQPEEYIEKPNVSLMEEFVKSSGDKIKEVTLAPEIEGAEELIKYLASKKIVASIGHSNAKASDVKNAISWGADSITHTYNAQSPLHHREAGVVGSAMLCDELYTEIICDMIHVCPDAVKMLVKNKPDDKVILITDSMRAKHLPDGESELGGQKVYVKCGEARLADGTLAGSVLKMNDAIKNLVQKVGVPFEKAVRFATLNPATSLNLQDSIGSISVGKSADFCIMDKDYNVLQTIVNGVTEFKL